MLIQSFFFVIIIAFKCKNYVQILPQLLWNCWLKAPEGCFPPLFFASYIWKNQFFIILLLNLPIIENIPMIWLIFVYSRLVYSQKKVDNQLSLRIQEIVCKVTLNRGKQLRNGTFENIFLFTQIWMMSFGSTILQWNLIAMIVKYFFKP